MGTFASLTVSAATADTLPARAQRAQDVFEELNQLLSTYIETSEISRLNAAAGGEVLSLSPPTREMLTVAASYSALSGGAFDITIAPLMQLWGFREGRPPTALPDPAARAALLPLVDYRLVEQDTAGARLARRGMRVDLGGIAKGYAVDVCFDALQRDGCRDLLVNLGGNMRGAGEPQPGRSWRVGVRNPFDRAALLGTLNLPDGWAVATSGNYEQFVEIEGVRYAHIMDPRTGQPVQGMAGVTVLSHRAVEADALSTALFVAGLEGAPAMLREAPDVEALLVPDRQPVEVYVTPGFKRHFIPAEKYRPAGIVKDLAVAAP